MGVIPGDALQAAREAYSGATDPKDMAAATLEFQLSQLQPALRMIEEALGQRVDAAGFALGMLAWSFAATGVDLLGVIRLMPEVWTKYLRDAAALQDKVVCGHRPKSAPSITCGLDPGHGGQHGAGRLRWDT